MTEAQQPEHTHDERARAAADSLRSGAASTIEEAIALLPPGPPPPAGLIRRHLEAMDQASKGLGDWWRERLEALEALTQLLDTIAFLLPESTILLTGRTAQGHVDGLSAARVRVIGVEAPHLVDALEQHGFRPPDVSAQRTSLGSMPVVHLFDHLGHQVDCLVLPDVPQAHDGVNLVDGGRVSVLAMERFEAIVEAARRTTSQFSPQSPPRAGD
ncbi:MAG: hypothetical protein MK101_09295 [Phycisphaerales bacterium]|nr:hypothetical protein [Phycisphaerales bacterium]